MGVRRQVVVAAQEEDLAVVRPAEVVVVASPRGIAGVRRTGRATTATTTTTHRIVQRQQPISISSRRPCTTTRPTCNWPCRQQPPRQWPKDCPRAMPREALGDFIRDRVEVVVVDPHQRNSRPVLINHRQRAGAVVVEVPGPRPTTTKCRTIISSSSREGKAVGIVAAIEEEAVAVDLIIKNPADHPLRQRHRECMVSIIAGWIDLGASGVSLCNLSIVRFSLAGNATAAQLSMNAMLAANPQFASLSSLQSQLNAAADMSAALLGVATAGQGGGGGGGHGGKSSSGGGGAGGMLK